jgi:cell division protein FtsB
MKLRLTTANIINVLGLFVILYLGAMLFNSLSRNYSLGQQMGVLNAQIARLQDERDTLSYQIQYDKTESYQEREARSKLGLQLPGENVVILPKPAVIAEEPAVKPAPKRSNIQQWLDFLTGRSDS